MGYSKDKTAFLHMRISPAVKAMVKELASNADLTVSEWVSEMIKEHAKMERKRAPITQPKDFAE